jgi:ATP-dependent Clp protease ATP-binding subunit ClpC
MAQLCLGLFIGLGLASLFRHKNLPGSWAHLEAFLSRCYQQARAFLKQAKTITAPTQDTAPETYKQAQVSLEAADEPLAVKLRKCETAFLPVADDAAHPREFYDAPDFEKAVSLLADPAIPLKTVTQYAFGANWGLSCAAFAALAQRADREGAREETLSAFERFAPWVMFYALIYLQTLAYRPPTGSLFVSAKDWWQTSPVMIAIAQEFFEESEACGDRATFGRALDIVPHASFPLIRGFLGKVVHPFARTLIAEIEAKELAYIDRTYLTSFGRFWSEDKIAVEPETWQENLAAAEITVTQTPRRSLLVSGEQGVGKTSFLHLLARRLGPQGWTVFEASGADIMAGQKYIGEIEGRIREAMARLDVSKKLIWYIPDILQIALSGTHRGQAASILDQIIPPIASSRLIVWTEASASASVKLLQMRPSLRNHFEVIRLEPLSQDETLGLVNKIVSWLETEGGLKIDPALPGTALRSARQYLSGTALPGSVLDLVKSTAARALKAGNRSVAGLNPIEQAFSKRKAHLRKHK